MVSLVIEKIISILLITLKVCVFYLLLGLKPNQQLIYPGCSAAW